MHLDGELPQRAQRDNLVNHRNLRTKIIMPVELKVPAVGESITEVQIAKWLKSEGDHVEQDENICEIETDKATVELPAPVTGVLTKLLKRVARSARRRSHRVHRRRRGRSGEQSRSGGAAIRQVATPI